MDGWSGVLLLAGLVGLLLGGEALVRSASGLAASWGVSPLMIGLTVVAFGTSAPEFAVSMGSALTERPDIALGNVVGSNIFNILFILGLSALVSPLMISRQVIRLEVPILIAVSLLALGLTLDGRVGRLDGFVLGAGLLAYTGFAIRQGRKEGAGADDGGGAWPRSMVGQIALAAVGLALLAVGAGWFVEGAEGIARALGVSDLIIALTVVSVGTSLPEVATSVMASLRGQRDIAVGNVVGSCLFNLMGVLGVTAALAPEPIHVAEDALAFDLPVMVLAALVCLPVFFTGGTISRWEGLALLAYYLGYVAYLVLRATDPAAQELFHDVLLRVMLPGTLLLLAFSLWLDRRQRRAGA